MKYSQGAYNSARKNNWLDDAYKHMDNLRKPNGFWMIEKNCIEDAKKCPNKKDWYTNSRRSYGSAKKNGWLNDFFPLKADWKKKE